MSLESEIKIAFENAYSSEYRNYLSIKSTSSIDLLSYVFTAFTDGYIARNNKEK